MLHSFTSASLLHCNTQASISDHWLIWHCSQANGTAWLLCQHPGNFPVAAGIKAMLHGTQRQEVQSHSTDTRECKRLVLQTVRGAVAASAAQVLPQAQPLLEVDDLHVHFVTSRGVVR